jgi:hypothetical protein
MCNSLFVLGAAAHWTVSPPPVSYQQCSTNAGGVWNCAEGHYLQFEGVNGSPQACQCVLWCSDFSSSAGQLPGQPCGGLASNGLTCTAVKDSTGLVRNVCIPDAAGTEWHNLCAP